MTRVFLVTTRISVEDPRAAYEHAKRIIEDDALQSDTRVKAKWNPTQDEIEMIIGTEDDPKLDECLMLLMSIDPENIEGCDVDESMIHEVS